MDLKKICLEKLVLGFTLFSPVVFAESLTTSDIINISTPSHNIANLSQVSHNNLGNKSDVTGTSTNYTYSEHLTGQAYDGGVNGSLTTINNGVLADSSYATVKDTLTTEWTDNFHFFGTGTAIFNFTLTGNISNTGYGSNLTANGPYASFQFSEGGLNAATTAYNFTNSANLGAPYSLVSNGPFSYQWSTTVNFVDGWVLPFFVNASAVTQNGFLSYDFKLASVSLTGGSISNDPGSLSYGTSVPLPNTIFLMFSGLGLLLTAIRKSAKI